MMQRTNIYTKPATSPMDLDASKPTPRLALVSTGVNLAFLLGAALGAWVCYLFAPKTSYDDWHAWSVIGFALGVLVTVFCLQQAWVYGAITRQGWLSHYKRLDDWHNAMLDYYDQNNGQETMVSVSYYDLSSDHVPHALLAALAVHQQIATSNSRQVPFSRRALERGLTLSAGAHTIKIGDLPGTQPEKMATMLARLGLITGRDQRTAGVWVPQTLDDVIELVAKNQHRISNKRLNDE